MLQASSLLFDKAGLEDGSFIVPDQLINPPDSWSPFAHYGSYVQRADGTWITSVTDTPITLASLGYLDAAVPINGTVRVKIYEGAEAPQYGSQIGEPPSGPVQGVVWSQDIVIFTNSWLTTPAPTPARSAARRRSP